MARFGFFKADTIDCSSSGPNPDRNERARAEYCLDVVMCRNRMEFRVFARSSGLGSLGNPPVDVSAYLSSFGHAINLV